MDSQGYSSLQPPSGPGGRKLHIAHRRSPSELTPLMMEQLALQQQIDALQQQQQQIAATHQQYVNMGMISPQQQLGPVNPFMQSPIMPGHPAAFQYPQQLQQQQMAMNMNASLQQSPHRRNQSIANMGMGPPPAPSAGASGAYADMGMQSRENQNPRGGRGGSTGNSHTRRHSLALPEAKKAAELAEQKRRTSGFQFPIPGAAGADPPSPKEVSPTTTPAQVAQGSNQSASSNRGGMRGATHGRSQSMAVGNAGNGRTSMSFPNNAPFRFPGSSENTGDLQRRGSQGHNRTGSRNFEGNWRQPSINQPSMQEQQMNNMGNNMGNFQMNQQTGQRNHRGSISHTPMGSLGSFSFPNQPQIVQLPQGPVLVQQPQMFQNQGLNPLQVAQLQALQNAQNMSSMQGGQQQQVSAQQQQQQQRKTLFTPYLPQATLPALLSDGQLVAGTLRVNKKNRSDAYVTSTDLDADIFICGSKDRNRALEGDLVAIELLDVDEVWGQKREKEEKKKRKDNTDTRSGSITSVNDATTGGDSGFPLEGGMRRRGSLRQRPTQKKNDDVEVEGQSLLLMEEEEINDEQKPLYAGHVVAVIERVAGQMFSGTLGLLRPSSQATKEKQEAERQTRDGNNGRNSHDRQQDKPKIVWFKPTDKRVPLIAIPTEQAPRDFVERHQDYANRIFVACIKRWPITSLHPFGTLVEQLGEMGDLKAETDALLRDNNFGPDEFSDAVIRSVGYDEWSVETDGEAALEGRRDFREEHTFTIDPNGAKELDDAIHFKTLENGNVEIGMHVADVAHFIKASSLVDREAKKRGTGVYLMNRTVDMLPSRLSSDICSLIPGEDRYTVSVVFQIDSGSGRVLDDKTWIGKAVIKSSGKLSYEEVDTVLSGDGDAGLGEDRADQIRTLNQITQKFRQARFGDRVNQTPALRLLYQLDDENVPVEQNIFDSSPAHELIEELGHKANAFVAHYIHKHLGDKAWLRRQAPPNPRRLQTFAERMTRVGYEIDTSSSGTLQNSLFTVDDSSLRKGMETLLVKAMQRAKYSVAGQTPTEELAHFALNLPLYTHFTNPSRRYADIIVHRQVEAILAGDVSQFQEDLESLNKTAELCNTKKDSAQAAQEQSVHIELCRKIDSIRGSIGSDLICEGIVISVYESAFDIVIPEYGIEKRVHCDQLPVKKAEFDKNTRVLELYWEKGVQSSAYIPEDERSTKPTGMRGANASTRQFSKGDDEDLAGGMSGVSLDGNGAASAGAPESKITEKKKYLDWLQLRETDGNYIQDITEMKRVPVILKTDLSKSPPCLTIRAMNPFAV